MGFSFPGVSHCLALKTLLLSAASIFWPWKHLISHVSEKNIISSCLFAIIRNQDDKDIAYSAEKEKKIGSFSLPPFLPSSFPTLTRNLLIFRDYQSKQVHLSTHLKVDISNTFRAGIVTTAGIKLVHLSPHLL